MPREYQGRLPAACYRTEQPLIDRSSAGPGYCRENGDFSYVIERTWPQLKQAYRTFVTQLFQNCCAFLESVREVSLIGRGG